MANDVLLNKTQFETLVEEGSVDVGGETKTPDLNTVYNVKDESISLPIGAIFTSAIPITDASVHLLDGSEISQTGVYSEFVTLLKNLISSGYNLSCTLSQYQTDIANTGNCGKFVIDDTNNTVKLPTITRFIQGLSNLTNIGSSLEAGLPNITGFVDSGNSTPAFYPNNLSGAFYTTDSSQSKGATQGTGASRVPSISFDASRSSSIYGNSNTVQPQATQYPYYIVLANTYKTNIQVDIDEIVSDLNNLSAKMLTSSSVVANEILTFLNSNTVKSSGVKIENQQIIKPADSVMWWQGRDTALLRQLEYLGFFALMSFKTTNGDWSLGTYTNDTLNINYTPDTDYDNNTNNTRKKHVFGQYETGNGYVITEYSCSKSGNGYFKFNNGLIVQWGRTGETSNTTINYPTSFSSATSYSCAGTSNGWSGSYGNYGMSNLTKTGFYYNSDKNYVWLWVAIGY